MSRMLFLVVFCAAFCLCETQLAGRASLDPLLTTISKAPELSSFYSLISSTGDDGKKPGPDLEERFNLREDSLNFTIFAPTNRALQRLPSSVVTTLTSAPNYPLLLALIRTHIVEGYIPRDRVKTSSAPFEAIEGFSLTIDNRGRLLTNKDVTKSDIPIASQASLEDSAPIPASNGIIYQIDNLLDPWVTYFGEDIPSASTTNVQKRAGSMSDYVNVAPSLTRLVAVLERVNPDFLHTRLDQSPDGQETTFFAPSNTAFELLPEAAMEKAMESGNSVMTSWLLEFGLTSGGGGGAKLFESQNSGFNITMDPRGRKVSNAKVEQRICLNNGCVVVVGRWLDPLYGVM